MENCVNHPHEKALSVCRGCGKPYCKFCLNEGKEFYYCKKPACQELMKKESPQLAVLPLLVNCPNCSSELQLSEEDRVSGKFHCPDCEAYLDFTVQPPMVLEHKNYTEVFSSRNQGDIAVLKSFLDDSGIDYYVTGEDFLATYPLLQPAKFFVRDDQVAETRELLKQFDVNAFGVSWKNRNLE